MSVIESTDRGEARRPTRRPRRGWTRRLSGGHVLMLVAALLAGLLNFIALRGGDDTVTVWSAAVDLQPGERLTADRLAPVDIVTGERVLAGLLEVDASLAGRVVTRRIAAGELVRASDLGDEGARDGLRAMSIAVDPARAVGGQLRVGDRVDLIEVTDASARYVASDVEVIAVGDRAGSGALAGIGAYSVTVAVDADTALRLAVAARADQLEIVRSTGAAPIGDASYVRPSDSGD